MFCALHSLGHFFVSQMPWKVSSYAWTIYCCCAVSEYCWGSNVTLNHFLRSDWHWLVWLEQFMLVWDLWQLQKLHVCVIMWTRKRWGTLLYIITTRCHYLLLPIHIPTYITPALLHPHSYTHTHVNARTNTLGVPSLYEKMKYLPRINLYIKI